MTEQLFKRTWRELFVRCTAILFAALVSVFSPIRPGFAQQWRTIRPNFTWAVLKSADDARLVGTASGICALGVGNELIPGAWTGTECRVGVWQNGPKVVPPHPNWWARVLRVRGADAAYWDDAWDWKASPGPGYVAGGVTPSGPGLDSVYLCRAHLRGYMSSGSPDTFGALRWIDDGWRCVIIFKGDVAETSDYDLLRREVVVGPVALNARWVQIRGPQIPPGLFADGSGFGICRLGFGTEAYTGSWVDGECRVALWPQESSSTAGKPDAVSLRPTASRYVDVLVSDADGGFWTDPGGDPGPEYVAGGVSERKDSLYVCLARLNGGFFGRYQGVHQGVLRWIDGNWRCVVESDGKAEETRDYYLLARSATTPIIAYGHRRGGRTDGSPDKPVATGDRSPASAKGRPVLDFAHDIPGIEMWRDHMKDGDELERQLDEKDAREAKAAKEAKESNAAKPSPSPTPDGPKKPGDPL